MSGRSARRCASPVAHTAASVAPGWWAQREVSAREMRNTAGAGKMSRVGIALGRVTGGEGGDGQCHMGHKGGGPVGGVGEQLVDLFCHSGG